MSSLAMPLGCRSFFVSSTKTETEKASSIQFTFYFSSLFSREIRESGSAWAIFLTTRNSLFTAIHKKTGLSFCSPLDANCNSLYAALGFTFDIWSEFNQIP